MFMFTEMLKKGGAWLGAARNWIQWNKGNGSRVAWGGGEVLVPYMTTKDAEEIACTAAAAEREHCAKLIETESELPSPIPEEIRKKFGELGHEEAHRWTVRLLKEKMAKKIREG